MPRAKRALVFAAFLALALTAYLVRRRLRATGTEIPARGGEPSKIQLTGPEPLYLQRDPRWAADKLGATSETLGAVGCLVCSLAMGSTALGAPLDPAELNRRLAAQHGYTRDALVIWEKIADATGGTVEAVVYADPDHASLDRALRDGHLPVVKFILPNGAPHWVLVVGKEGDDYLVKDPLVSDRPILALSTRTATIRSMRVLRRAEGR